jgi:aspartokinase
VREGVGAVSVIGAGINASFRTVRRCLEVVSQMPAELLGLSTSSFRVSLLLEERHVREAVGRLHEALVAAEPV